MLPLIRHHARALAHSPSTGIFLGFGWMLTILLTLSYGQFLAANNAGLHLMYGFLPWVLCLLIPALTMNVADEPARGVQERLYTLPFTPTQRLAARFTVHWALIGIWLLGFWPMAATVFYLGNPDVGPMLTGLIGTWLLAAPLLAAALFVVRQASGSVTGFLMALGACLALTLVGAPQTVTWLAATVPAMLASPLIWLLQSATLFAAFTPFVAGFISLGALVTIAAYTLVFFALALPRMATRLPLLFAAVLLLGLAFMPAFARMGVDATAEGLHSLSPATVKALKELPEPVTFTLYQSTNNPDIPPSVLQTAETLRKMLIAMRQLNPDKISLLALNPDASPEHALQALRAGMEEQVLPSGTGFFSGLSAQTGSHNISLIRKLSPDRKPFLEFDVMSLLHEAQRTQKPNIALLTTINTVNPTAVPRWMAEVGNAYTMEQLPFDAAQIPPQTNLLLIVGNFPVGESLLSAIAAYLENGGNIVWLADPLWRTAPADLKTTSGTRTLAEFFSHYGVVAAQDVVVGDNAQATPVAQEKTGFTAYPFWLSLTHANLNAELPFATFVDALLLAEPGTVEAENLKPGLTFTPVVGTSPHAQLMPRQTFDSVPAELLVNELTMPEGARTLAALVTGAFGANPGKPATLLVVNDIDWLSNAFALRSVSEGPGTGVEYRPTNSNLVLFFNALQYTLGETELVSLRGKGTTQRTLTRVESLLADLTRRTTVLEQKLAAELYRVSARLSELQADNAPSPVTGTEAFTSAQQAEIQSYQQQQFKLRQQLRELRSHTRSQIQGLETSILLLNLLTMPVLLAIGLLLWRRRQPK